MAKKILTEQQVAFEDLRQARLEVARAEQMFDYASPDFFEIANIELTIAQMRYEVCVKKLRLLTEGKKYEA